MEKDMKTCRECKNSFERTSANFYRNKSCKDGFVPICKNCSREYNKRYRENNKEKILENGKRWREENKDKVLEYYTNNKYRWKEYRDNNKEKKNKWSREVRNKDSAFKRKRQQYNLTNKEKISKQQKEYNRVNKERVRVWRLEWRKNNRDKDRSYTHKRRAKQRNLKADLTIEQWRYIQTFFDNKCAYCGREEKLQQDHFIPVEHEGEYTFDNIIPACISCNSSKRDNHFIEWYPKYKYYSKDRELKILDFLSHVKSMK